MLPEMMLVGSVPDRYEFESLKLEEHGRGNFVYTYEYENPRNPEEILHIKGLKKIQDAQILFYGSNVKIDDVNFELYCKDNVDTDGVTGMCIMSSQTVTISGNISQEEVIDIAKSLSL